MFGVGPNENGKLCYKGKEENGMVARGINRLKRVFFCFSIWGEITCLNVDGIFWWKGKIC